MPTAKYLLELEIDGAKLDRQIKELKDIKKDLPVTAQPGFIEKFQRGATPALPGKTDIEKADKDEKALQHKGIIQRKEMVDGIAGLGLKMLPLVGIATSAGGILASMQAASGILQGSFGILSSAMSLFFKPFGDALGVIILPVFYKWLEWILGNQRTLGDIATGIFEGTKWEKAMNENIGSVGNNIIATLSGGWTTMAQGFKGIQDAFASVYTGGLGGGMTDQLIEKTIEIAENTAKYTPTADDLAAINTILGEVKDDINSGFAGPTNAIGSLQQKLSEWGWSREEITNYLATFGEYVEFEKSIQEEQKQNFINLVSGFENLNEGDFTSIAEQLKIWGWSREEVENYLATFNDYVEFEKSIQEEQKQNFYNLVSGLEAFDEGGFSAIAEQLKEWGWSDAEIQNVLALLAAINNDTTDIKHGSGSGRGGTGTQKDDGTADKDEDDTIPFEPSIIEPKYEEKEFSQYFEEAFAKIGDYQESRKAYGHELSIDDQELLDAIANLENFEAGLKKVVELIDAGYSKPDIEALRDQGVYPELTGIKRYAIDEIVNLINDVKGPASNEIPEGALVYGGSGSGERGYTPGKNPEIFDLEDIRVLSDEYNGVRHLLETVAPEFERIGKGIADISHNASKFRLEGIRSGQLRDMGEALAGTFAKIMRMSDEEDVDPQEILDFVAKNYKGMRMAGLELNPDGTDLQYARGTIGDLMQDMFPDMSEEMNKMLDMFDDWNISLADFRFRYFDKGIEHFASPFYEQESGQYALGRHEQGLWESVMASYEHWQEENGSKMEENAEMISETIEETSSYVTDNLEKNNAILERINSTLGNIDTTIKDGNNTQQQMLAAWSADSIGRSDTGEGGTSVAEP